ncbi:hypothetical protein, partial [Nevskia ramosa]|uniref:hypothetical protein n=1 Tax=Nevskia ramosa TaxID=64002 RepID=UPI002354C86F
AHVETVRCPSSGNNEGEGKHICRHRFDGLKWADCVPARLRPAESAASRLSARGWRLLRVTFTTAGNFRPADRLCRHARSHLERAF